MWVEGLRGSDARRLQIVELPDYQAGPTVAAQPTPDDIPYGSSDLSVVPGLAAKASNIDVKVYGKVSGHIVYRRTPSSIEKIYTDYSDDGRNVYSGQEMMQLNPRAFSTYTADLRVSGDKPGVMDLKMTFGPLGGELPARLVFDRDASGAPRSHGFAEYDGRRLTVESLAP